jgi:hypothetical protein
MSSGCATSDGGVAAGERGHGAFGEVAAVSGLPFVVGFDQYGAGEPEQGVGVREDAYLELPVSASNALTRSSTFRVLTPCR